MQREFSIGDVVVCIDAEDRGTGTPLALALLHKGGKYTISNITPLGFLFVEIENYTYWKDRFVLYNVTKKGNKCLKK